MLSLPDDRDHSFNIKCDLLQQNPEQVAWDYFKIYKSLKFQSQKYCQKVKFEVLVFL